MLWLGDFIGADTDVKHKPVFEKDNPWKHMILYRLVFIFSPIRLGHVLGLRVITNALSCSHSHRRITYCTGRAGHRQWRTDSFRVSHVQVHPEEEPGKAGTGRWSQERSAGGRLKVKVAMVLSNWLDFAWFEYRTIGLSKLPTPEPRFATSA